MIVIQFVLMLVVSFVGAPSSVRCPPDWWGSAPTSAGEPRVVCSWSREDGTGKVELFVPLRCPPGQRGVVSRYGSIVRCQRR